VLSAAARCVHLITSEFLIAVDAFLYSAIIIIIIQNRGENDTRIH